MGGVIYRLFIPYILLALVLGNPLSIGYLLKILYGHIENVNGVAHLWYLPCFMISVLIFITTQTFTKGKHRILMPFLVFVSGFISSYFNYDNKIQISFADRIFHLTGYAADIDNHYYIGFPYSFNAALTGFVLMYFGFLLKKFFNRYEVFQSKLKCTTIGLISLFIGLTSYLINQSNLENDFPFHLVTPSYSIYGNYILFLLTSVTLTIFIFCLSNFVDNKYTALYGRETLIIYAFHPFVASLVSILGVPSFNGILPSILILIITCMLIPVIKRIDPYLIGEKI